MAYHRFHHIDTRIVRIFNTYGPRMHIDDGRVVPNFIQQALRGEPLTIYGDGTQTRSFCYVDDLVEGVVRLLHSDENSPVNIGNPEETTILEFAQKINEHVGNNAGVVHKLESRGEGDPQRRRPDISRAQNILNWQPKATIEYGLDQTIPYFKTKIGLG